MCDAGLGGLARWLRAAGYEAVWQPDIADDELLRQARAMPATILTTDSMLMERRLLRDGIIPAFWLPPTLRIPEQLALVFREFGLTLRGPRCMSCGGELRRGYKEALRERIPPRTYRWLDEYFVCGALRQAILARHPLAANREVVNGVESRQQQRDRPSLSSRTPIARL